MTSVTPCALPILVARATGHDQGEAPTTGTAGRADAEAEYLTLSSITGYDATSGESRLEIGGAACTIEGADTPSYVS